VSCAAVLGVLTFSGWTLLVVVAVVIVALREKTGQHRQETGRELSTARRPLEARTGEQAVVGAGEDRDAVPCAAG
jgi:hypothetical protein